MKKIRKQIDAAWVAYQRKVEDIATLALMQKIDPYLRKHGIKFVNGMGTYYLSKNGAGVDPESLPKKLQDILEMEIPGMQADTLGSVCNIME